jgi:hypothetical protein
MTESRKTLIIVVAAIAALIAIYSGWKTFSGSRTLTEQERMNTSSGPISSRSSILGPDASGKPQTQMPGSGQTAPTQSPGGMTPSQRMQGGSGQ